MYVYRGPGHLVEIDELVVRRDEPVELTAEQVARMRAADPLARIDEAEVAEDAVTSLKEED